jgi:hypothetical protein
MPKDSRYDQLNNAGNRGFDVAQIVREDVDARPNMPVRRTTPCSRDASVAVAADEDRIE